MRKLLSFLPYRILLFYVYTLFFSTKINRCLSSINEWYESCGKEFNCGDIKGISYPFWGDDRPNLCGYAGLELKCLDNITTMEIKKVKYRVLGITPNAQSIKIARNDFLGGVCKAEFVNTTLDDTLFDYSPGYGPITIFYGCLPPLAPLPENKFSCTIDGIPYNGNFAALGSLGPGLLCKVSVVVPISKEYPVVILDPSTLDKPLTEGFEVNLKVDYPLCLKCRKSSGRCAYNHSSNQPTCLCPNGSQVPDACDESIAGDFKPASSIAPEWSGSNDQCNTCFDSGGSCGYNSSEGGFTCFCKDGPNASTCTGKKSNITTIAAGISGGAVGILVISLFIFFFQRRKQRIAQSKTKELPTPPSSTIPSVTVHSYYASSKSDLERGSMYFGVQVFTYEELEEATDNFDSSKELGDGGFGRVYYGKLRDGRVVAVKRLYENNFKRVEQFINEVEILTRLRHQNLVTLYGCTSRRSRELLLVYEYIPNGTVADHLHGRNSNSGLLTWPIRMSIAIETADALAYLHASDIIHRDVKTNNILLDNNFRVKVADFGLSRLFPTDVTHVSTAPQGTPGYVDPEYYQCYQLTDKSDVYSFGVVLVELISSKMAVDTNRHRHDINLANMAINKIQSHSLIELVDPFLGFETDYKVQRMITSVAGLAFRCLQQERDMRPSMDEVLEALKGMEKEDFSAVKAEVVDLPVDYDDILKGDLSPLSTDSAATTIKWASNSTTPNFSG